VPHPHDNNDAIDPGQLVDFSIPPEFDNSQAQQEGWGIFSCIGSDNGEFQLCRLDEEAIFPDDQKAWLFVISKAAEGSIYHRSALDYIREHNPIEWASFGKEHGEPLVHVNGAPMLDAAGALMDQNGEHILNDKDVPHRFHPDGGAIRDKPGAAVSSNAQPPSPPANPLDTLVALHDEKGRLSIETASGVPVAISTEQFPISDLRTLFRQFTAARGMEAAINDALEIFEPAAMVAESHGATETAAILRETGASLMRAVQASR
jgi:hypothetical protein